MKQLTIQGPDGAPLTAYSFGEVPEGQLGTLAIALRNTGDAPLTGVRAWIEQASTSDGELRVTLAGVAITGTTRETATPLPDLAPGAAHAGTAQHTSPTIPVDTGTLRAAAV
ncbi:hypothetical protein [Deinococcus kurensis]|uniref:hypothetical protein n=1 Tax=Deinococcus kurensis TaxID=2662757 RepID=UPI0012D33BBD|nr:hypothetical protein [Deinococcus kurensis]